MGTRFFAVLAAVILAMVLGCSENSKVKDNSTNTTKPGEFGVYVDGKKLNDGDTIDIVSFEPIVLEVKDGGGDDLEFVDSVVVDIGAGGAGVKKLTLSKNFVFDTLSFVKEGYFGVDVKVFAKTDSLKGSALSGVGFRVRHGFPDTLFGIFVDGEGGNLKLKFDSTVNVKNRGVNWVWNLGELKSKLAIPSGVDYLELVVNKDSVFSVVEECKGFISVRKLSGLVSSDSALVYVDVGVISFERLGLSVGGQDGKVLVLDDFSVGLDSLLVSEYLDSVRIIGIGSVLVEDNGFGGKVLAYKQEGDYEVICRGYIKDKYLRKKLNRKGAASRLLEKMLKVNVVYNNVGGDLKCVVGENGKKYLDGSRLGLGSGVAMKVDLSSIGLGEKVLGDSLLELVSSNVELGGTFEAGVVKSREIGGVKYETEKKTFSVVVSILSYLLEVRYGSLGGSLSDVGDVYVGERKGNSTVGYDYVKLSGEGVEVKEGYDYKLRFLFKGCAVLGFDTTLVREAKNGEVQALIQLDTAMADGVPKGFVVVDSGCDVGVNFAKGAGWKDDGFDVVSVQRVMGKKVSDTLDFDLGVLHGGVVVNLSLNKKSGVDVLWPFKARTWTGTKGGRADMYAEPNLASVGVFGPVVVYNVRGGASQGSYVWNDVLSSKDNFRRDKLYEIELTAAELSEGIHVVSLGDVEGGRVRDRYLTAVSAWGGSTGRGEKVLSFKFKNGENTQFVLSSGVAYAVGTERVDTVLARTRDSLYQTMVSDRQRSGLDTFYVIAGGRSRIIYVGGSNYGPGLNSQAASVQGGKRRVSVCMPMRKAGGAFDTVGGVWVLKVNLKVANDFVISKDVNYLGGESEGTDYWLNSFKNDSVGIGNIRFVKYLVKDVGTHRKDACVSGENLDTISTALCSGCGTNGVNMFELVTDAVINLKVSTWYDSILVVKWANGNYDEDVCRKGAYCRLASEWWGLSSDKAKWKEMDGYLFYGWNASHRTVLRQYKGGVAADLDGVDTIGFQTLEGEYTGLVSSIYRIRNKIKEAVYKTDTAKVPYQKDSTFYHYYTPLKAGANGDLVVDNNYFDKNLSMDYIQGNRTMFSYYESDYRIFRKWLSRLPNGMGEDKFVVPKMETAVKGWYWGSFKRD